MSALTEYTLEIYKADKRIKKDQRYGRDRAGLRFVETKDFAPSTKDFIASVAEAKRKEGYVVNVFETYVTVKNLLTGKPVKERYDTPYSCSVASESYFSN
jgi:hypothetical protein